MPSGRVGRETASETTLGPDKPREKSKGSQGKLGCTHTGWPTEGSAPTTLYNSGDPFMPPLGTPPTDVRGCGLRTWLLVGGRDNSPEETTAWMKCPSRICKNDHG